MKQIAWIVTLISFFLSGCGVEISLQDHAHQDLSLGVKLFEEGEFSTSEQVLQHALKDELTRNSDKVRAHKYLAFIMCVTDRPVKCRAEFKKVIELDPKFELTPAEAGHPLWGPAFREEKASSAK